MGMEGHFLCDKDLERLLVNSSECSYDLESWHAVHRESIRRRRAS